MVVVGRWRGWGCCRSDAGDVVQALYGGGVAARLAAEPRAGDSGRVVLYRGAKIAL